MTPAGSSDHEPRANGTPAQRGEHDAGAGWQLVVYFRAVLRKVWGATADLLLLTLFIAIVHDQGPMEATESYFRRQVVASHMTRLFSGDSVDRPSPAHTVHVLELSSFLRVSKLEGKGEADRRVIDRLGVRPIDRCIFGEVIERIAERLKANGPSMALENRVVGIDVDVTPLDAADSEKCGGSMQRALKKLRMQATVVAVVFPRGRASERATRNEFMKESCGAADAGQKPLHYASSAVFSSKHEYPLDFPYESEVGHGGPAAGPSAKLPAVFPSLGNLVGLAAWPSASRSVDSAASLDALCSAAGSAAFAHVPAATPDEKDDVCSSPSQQVTDPTLLRDLFEPTCAHDQIAQDVVQGHKMRAYNWRWLHLDYVQPHEIGTLEELPRIEPEVWTSQALIVSVDGGGHDSFDLPSASGGRSSGSMLHALQALSVLPGMGLLQHSPVAVLADLFVGLMFLLGWYAVLPLISQLYKTPSIHAFFSIVAPLSIAWLLYRLVIQRGAAGMLTCNIWVNPIYALTGLVLHSYIEAWHGKPTRERKPHPAEGPDFSFDVRRVWTAFGRARHSGGRIAHWRELADATLAMLVKLASIGFGLVVLLHTEPGSANRPAWIFPLIIGVVALVILVSLIYRRRWRRP